MGKQGFSSTPVLELKGLIDVLAKHYSCRVSKVVVVNVYFGAKILWKIIKNFIDTETLEKVTLTDNNTDPELLKLVRPN